MRIRLLGGFAVDDIPDRGLGSKKGRTLLRLLAVNRGTPVSVDRLADVLWADDQPARPGDQVGVLVARLRAVLGTPRITRSDGGYALAADWIDVEELDRLAAAAADALDAGRIGAARAATDAALSLVRGPLLPDDDGDWVAVERAAVDAVVTRVRRLAVAAAVAAGDHGGAAALAEQALAADPFDEVVLRALMAAHIEAGRPASALAAYARVRAQLAEDLGVSPTAETEALHGRALLAADGEPPVTVVAQPPETAVLGGRETELAELGRAFDRAASGGTELVVVEGEPGIGKTMLVDAWSRRVGAEAVVLRGRCDELGRDLPLQPVADALADHLGEVGPQRAMEILGPDALTLEPLLGVGTVGSATRVSDAETGRAAVFAALVAVLGRTGGDRPTVLVIEDLHLVGASTRAWLAFARHRSRRAMFVVTTRIGGAAGLEPTEAMRVGPLDLAAVAGLVGHERAAGVFARTGGHPLLVAALIPGGEDDDVPVTVRDAVAARVDSLGEVVGATLRTAAALGSDCDLDLLAQVGATDVLTVLTHLEVAATAGLVVERGRGFAFRHELIREALEASMGAPRRALVHREAARILSGRPDGDALAVATHARAGGDVVLAAASFAAAASAAASRYDLDRAEELLAVAIELDPSATVHVARARVRMSRSALTDAAADADAAITAGGGPEALEVAGWVAYYRRHYDDARAYADAVLERADDVAIRTSALALSGRVRHANGDLAGAVDRLASVPDGPAAVRGVGRGLAGAGARPPGPARRGPRRAGPPHGRPRCARPPVGAVAPADEPDHGPRPVGSGHRRAASGGRPRCCGRPRGRGRRSVRRRREQRRRLGPPVVGSRGGGRRAQPAGPRAHRRRKRSDCRSHGRGSLRRPPRPGRRAPPPWRSGLRGRAG